MADNHPCVIPGCGERAIAELTFVRWPRNRGTPVAEQVPGCLRVCEEHLNECADAARGNRPPHPLVPFTSCEQGFTMLSLLGRL